jgi:hypothetical protein
MTPSRPLAELWRLHQQGQLSTAEAGYREFLSGQPQHAIGWCYLGMVLADQHRDHEAVVAYERSIALDPTIAETWNNLGNALRALGCFDQAEAAFDRAVAIRPNYALAELNRGTARTWRGDLNGALEAFSRAVQMAPDQPDIQRNYGVMRLLHGDYATGWPAYHHRWQMRGFRRPAPESLLWRGDDPRGRTFFLYPEQGLGDLIQFVRMAAVLRQHGARTIVGCPPKMLGLLQSCAGIDCLVADGMPTPPWDRHCSLLEIAEHFVDGRQSIPATIPYLSAAPNLREYWGRWLAGLPAGRRIGLVWQGNPQHEADRFRSLPLAMLEPLSAVDGITWLSLQQGFGSEQLPQCDWANGPRAIHRLPADTDQTNGSFMDSAAILEHLDLLITTDTSIAHLAGACGRPVWLLLSAVPDWRWGLQSADTPWYPSLRLWRQPQMGDWGSVIQNVTQALRDEFGG